MHVHSGPDVTLRSVNDFQLAYALYEGTNKKAEGSIANVLGDNDSYVGALPLNVQKQLLQTDDLQFFTDPNRSRPPRPAKRGSAPCPQHRLS